MLFKRITLFVICVLGLAACTPEQLSLFNSLNPDQQTQVIEALQANNRHSDCISAMEATWPADTHAWGRKIIMRESGNSPTARNPSGASGCWQLMLPMHSGRFTRVGCSPSQWSDPDCNSKAALTLYQEAGTRPWVATNY